MMGGLEKKLYDFISRLDASHHRITVCCLKAGGHFKQPLVDLGVTFYDEIMHHKFDVMAYGRMLNIIAQHDIDLIYTVTHPNTMIFADLARRMGKVRRVVVSIHSTGSHKGGALFSPVQRRFLGGVDRFISVAEKHKRYLIESERLDGSKITVIHNGVDTDIFHPASEKKGLRDELGIAADERVVITVAKLRPLKCIDILLRSAQGVLADVPNARFVLVGGGPERENLEALAADLGIAHKVTFAGQRDDVPDLLRMADLFVLSSRTEAFPNVVLEAMATRLPVITTDVGSVSEMVESGRNALLVPTESVNALRDALVEILADDQKLRTFATRGREIVEERFRIETMCDKRTAVFDELLCNSNP
jgi:glycosyltransferase involved in cell wall biosynthesis